MTNKWEYLEDEYGEDENFVPIRKDRGVEEHLAEFHAETKKIKARKQHTQARKLKQYDTYQEEEV